MMPPTNHWQTSMLSKVKARAEEVERAKLEQDRLEESKLVGGRDGNDGEDLKMIDPRDKAAAEALTVELAGTRAMNSTLAEYSKLTDAEKQEKRKAESYWKDDLIENGGPFEEMAKDPFFRRYREAMVNNPAVKESSTVHANVAFIHQASHLFGVKCRICSGWGHTANHCGLFHRLHAAAGSDPMVLMWIDEALKSDNYLKKAAAHDMSALKKMPHRVPPGYLDKDGKLKQGAKKVKGEE